MNDITEEEPIEERNTPSIEIRRNLGDLEIIVKGDGWADKVECTEEFQLALKKLLQPHYNDEIKNEDNFSLAIQAVYQDMIEKPINLNTPGEFILTIED